MFLSEQLREKVIFCGRTYVIDISFDTVLEVQRLFREEELPDAAKIEQAIKMFVMKNRKALHMPVKAMSELLGQIFDECINT